MEVVPVLAKLKVLLGPGKIVTSFHFFVKKVTAIVTLLTFLFFGAKKYDAKGVGKNISKKLLRASS